MPPACPPGEGAVTVGRVTQLVLACFVLGTGVALLLDARLGSDGYSTMVNGIRLSADLPFWAVNFAFAVAFVAIAWARGVRPGLGTIVQPVVVGFTVSWVVGLAPSPTSTAGRGIELAVAFVLLGLGVAGYLASRLGAGPTEAAALAWDPPLPFRWSYSTLQFGGALTGWAFGADIGVATVLVIVALGPVVDLLSRLVFRTTPESAA